LTEIRLTSGRACFALNPGSVAWLPSLEPLPEGFVALARFAARQQALNADILVQIWPMNTFAVRYQSPVLALQERSVSQPRKPGEWCCYSSTVLEINDKGFVRDVDAASQRLL
jgi:hypothetical protein